MSGYAPVLENIERGRLCAGCGACAALVQGIHMEQSNDGFNRPVASTGLTRDEVTRIESVCPGLGLQTQNRRKQNALWGNMISLRMGHATDPKLRFRASSGGALSAILVHLLNSKSVDFIVHTGAVPADPVANQARVSSTASEITEAAGSRYAPSSPLADIERHLLTGKRFAFVGKPCDVAALRAMARSDARIDESVVCMVSFFCAGVPSRKGAREILDRLGVRPGFLRSFRYRGHGWPGAATAQLSDGSQRQMSYRESWGDILSTHVQFRCKICPDGTGDAADIVCADAWRSDAHGYPSFDEAKGRSLILTRTQCGEKIVQAARKSKTIATIPQNVSELATMQPGQATRMRVLVARLAALWLTAQPRPNYRGFDLLSAANGASLFELLKNFLGTGRRVIQGRR